MPQASLINISISTLLPLCSLGMDSVPPESQNSAGRLMLSRGRYLSNPVPPLESKVGIEPQAVLNQDYFCA